MSMRQSGRTTTMLQAAAVAQEWGHVLIVVPNRGIEQHCRSLADKHGITFHRVDFCTIEPILRGKYRGFSGQIYEDHTVWEMPSSDIQQKLAHELALLRIGMPKSDPVDSEEEERLRLREELRQSQAVSN
jgi:hypothetical protein